MKDALGTFFSLVWEGIGLFAELGFLIMLPFLIIAALVLIFYFAKSQKRKNKVIGLKGASNETFGELKARWFKISQKYLEMEALYDKCDSQAIRFFDDEKSDVRHFIRELNDINEQIRELEDNGTRDSERVTVVLSMQVTKAARVWNKAIESRT